MKRIIKGVLPVLAFIIVAGILFVLFGNPKNKKPESPAPATKTESTVTEKPTEAPKPTTQTTLTTLTTTPEPTKQSDDDYDLEFWIKSNEKSEYGKKLTINKGTEFEVSFTGYQIPAGHYVIINNNRDTAVQISPIYDKINVVNGLEEFDTPEDCFPVVIMQGKLVEYDVPEGVYLKITEPYELSLFRAGTP